MGGARGDPSSSRLIVVSGPSGAGKGTLIRRLLDQTDDFKVAVSATTRRQRPGEVDGVHYLFLDDAEFQRRVDAGEFLEHVSFAGGRYGTLASEVDRLLESGSSVILELEIEGAFAIRRRRHDALLVFIAPPSFDVLERRLRDRATESSGDIDTRLEIAREQLAERNHFDAVVVNDDVERAAGELLATLRGAIQPTIEAIQ
jgi:guanylate kinase